MPDATAQRRTWLTWTLWILVLGAQASAIGWMIVNWSTPLEEIDSNGAWQRIVTIGVAFVYLVIAGLGTLIVGRRPAHPVGWLLCLTGAIGITSIVAAGYAIYALLTDPGSLPAGTFAAWFSGVTSGPLIYIPIVLLFLIFPTGSLLSRRWRPFVGLLCLGGVLTFGGHLEPGEIENIELHAQNPLGIESAEQTLWLSGVIGYGLIMVVAFAAALSVALRFIGARGDERQQIKWLVLAGLIVMFVSFSGPLMWSVPVLNAYIWPVVFVLGLSAIPVCTTMAILRYRLYDIDLIINRTLVYASLTATLLAIYLTLVFGIGWLIQSVVDENSSLVIAGSTLMVAALFRPLRERIQGTVDRRFYRRKYDAARTLETFSARLRDEIDLETLTTEVQIVVRDTMQPAHISVWLRSHERR